MIARLLVVLTLAGLLHGYLGLRAIDPLPLPPWAHRLAWVALFGSFGLHPLAFSLRAREAPDAWVRLSAWASYLSLGLFALLLSWTFLRDVLWLAVSVLSTGPLLASALPGLYPGVDGQASWLAVSTEAVWAAVALSAGIGFVEARRLPRLRRVRVPIEGLPSALVGLRIVQLSDIHIGPTIRRAFLEAVVARVNAEEPDIIAITGDLVDGSVAQLRSQVEPLADLRARQGTFFVTGNHEYYAGGPAWCAHLRTLGLTVLENEHRLLSHAGASLVLAGVCDYTAGAFVAAHAHDPARALAGAPQGVPRILLAHQPRSAHQASGLGISLQLSGHTHGGQFLPWNFFVPLQQPTVAGLSPVGDVLVYTSRGTGHWGPPLRLGAPSEITVIELCAPEPLAARG